MPEKTIESAYRERLANRRLREQDLRELHADLVTTAVSLTVNGPVVAVARPENPLPAIPRVLDQSKAATIFDRAWHSPWHPYLHSLVAADHVLREAETKPSLRRVFANGRPILSRLDLVGSIKRRSPNCTSMGPLGLRLAEREHSALQTRLSRAP